MDERIKKILDFLNEEKFKWNKTKNNLINTLKKKEDKENIKKYIEARIEQIEDIEFYIKEEI